MRKITVTEENFNIVLKKLQRICNKYKMFEFYKVLSEDMTELKEFRRNPIGFRDRALIYANKDGKKEWKKVKKFYSCNKYVRVTKHSFREQFEKNMDSYDAKHAYPEMKPLIHLDLSADSALVIGDGDKIQFLPFGGFAIWTDNDFTRFENPPIIYKHTYFPDFIKGRIKDLENENCIRDAEIEESEEYYYNFCMREEE